MEMAELSSSSDINRKHRHLSLFHPPIIIPLDVGF
jgi:hypothetical protein